MSASAITNCNMYQPIQDAPHHAALVLTHGPLTANAQRSSKDQGNIYPGSKSVQRKGPNSMHGFVAVAGYDKPRNRLTSALTTGSSCT